MHWQHIVIDPNAFIARCHHQPHSSLGSWSFPHTHWCKPPTGTMSGMVPSPLADQSRFSYIKQLTGEGQFARLCSGQEWPTPTWTDCDTSTVVFGAAEEDVTERRCKTALRTVLPRRTIEKLDSSHPLSCLKQPAMRNKEQSHQPRQVTEGCQGLPRTQGVRVGDTLVPMGAWHKGLLEGLGAHCANLSCSSGAEPQARNPSALLADSTTLGKLCKKLLAVQLIWLLM